MSAMDHRSALFHPSNRGLMSDNPAEANPNHDQTEEIETGGKESSGQSTWAEVLNTDNFSLGEAIGGARGAVESLLPGVVFVVVYIITRSLGWTVGLSASVSILFCIVRLIQRTPLTQALAGLLGVAISVIWAVTSGKTENYYAWGLLTNVIYGVVLLLSVLVRQPLAAWAVKFLWQLPAKWKTQVEFNLLYRRCVTVTWVWAGVFFLRLIVQWPLYVSGQVAALGIAKLIMGIPIFALAAWFTWVLLRELKPHRAEGDTLSAGDQ